jgi:hypothetical protein
MRGAVFFSTCASSGDSDLTGCRKVLHGSPALARLVKRSPNELLCGMSSFILFLVFSGRCSSNRGCR